MDTYKYSAIVDGTYRAVTFEADAEDWGHEGAADEPATLNLESADLLIDNEYDTYREFYAGATDHEYDADRKERNLYIRVGDAWQIVEAD